jgi:hemolysin activation/secretion protein
MIPMPPLRRSDLFTLFLLVGFSGVAYGQATPPNAGEVFRGAREKAPLAPKPPSSGTLPRAAELTQADLKGGAQVEIKNVLFEGNTVYNAEQLKAIIRGNLGQRLDLAGMKALARRISDHYRQDGYPFARAVVPVQEFADGVLKITILEGRYDLVAATGEPAVVRGAQPFLAGLRPGDLMRSDSLERTMLILDDIPGVAVTPSVRPGGKVGTSELEVEVRMDSLYGGDYGLDNAGSRYTGYYRAHLSWYRNSLGMFGDRFSTMAMVTDLSMLLGSVDYEVPLGGRGLRWQFGYAHTTYELGKEYEALGASGLAKVWSSKLSLPLVRSQAANLSASAGIQHKDLQDDFIAAATQEAKSTVSFPVTLRFDYRDNLFTGGVSYGMLSCTFGHLTMDDALMAADAATARKAGSYAKYNFDLARIQSFGPALSLYGRISAQWADKNLDSSERLGIGGSEGVRAYPLGEGSGDTGWLGQVELRYVLGDFAPYLLYDVGSNRINAQAWDVASAQRRNLSGAGFGVRYDYEKWSGNLALAFRIDGGAPTQDVGASPYRISFSLSRSY